ncbi:MAG: hypothetical protein WDN04_08510 [Rhodospirillales bacterium]
MPNHAIPLRHRLLVPGLLATAILLVPAHAALAQSTSRDTAQEIAALKRALRAQQQVTRQLEQRLNALAQAQQTATQVTQTQLRGMTEQARQVARQIATEQIAAAPPPAGPAVDAGYNGGFYIKDPSGDNSLYINGLLQPRYRFFAPRGTTKFGAKDEASNNFDDFLARLYFSGNIADRASPTGSPCRRRPRGPRPHPASFCWTASWRRLSAPT